MIDESGTDGQSSVLTMAALLAVDLRWARLEAEWRAMLERHGLGAIMPREAENPELEAALATLDAIDSLDIETVIPGHGEPFTAVAEAIAEARSRLLAFKADVRKNARNFMKVMFTFSLLAKRSIGSAEARAYIARIPVYRDLNRRFVGLPDDRMAELLVEELKQVGAIAEKDGVITPSMKA